MRRVMQSVVQIEQPNQMRHADTALSWHLHASWAKQGGYRSMDLTRHAGGRCPHGETDRNELMGADHRAERLLRQHFQQQGVLDAPVDDMNRIDA